MYNSPSSFQFTSLPNSSMKYNPNSRYSTNNFQNFQFGQNTQNSYNNSFRNNYSGKFYILLNGVDERNNLNIYNYFNQFGDFQFFFKNLNEKIVILKYNSDEIVKIVTVSWERDGKNFKNVILSLINEENVSNYINNNNRRNYDNSYLNNNNQINTVIDNKSSFYKFLDVLLNL